MTLQLPLALILLTIFGLFSCAVAFSTPSVDLSGIKIAHEEERESARQMEQERSFPEYILEHLHRIGEEVEAKVTTNAVAQASDWKFRGEANGYDFDVEIDIQSVETGGARSTGQVATRELVHVRIPIGVRAKCRGKATKKNENRVDFYFDPELAIHISLFADTVNSKHMTKCVLDEIQPEIVSQHGGLGEDHWKVMRAAVQHTKFRDTLIRALCTQVQLPPRHEHKEL